MIWDYLATLKTEFSTLKGPFDTIYIGGGTPSMLDNEQLTFLLSIFNNEKPIEYTIEVNPESYTSVKGEIFKQFGINRISLGVQTFNKEHLADLKRAHTNEEVFSTIDHLNSIGLHNISVDLIFSLPSQTLDDVINDLNIIKELNIKHISYYELILEEKTIMYHEYKKGNLKLLDQDIQATMYNDIIRTLEESGFAQYEVSSYAKDEKYESLHNKIYWSLLPYEAIGAGSFGFDGNYRYEHTNNITKYIKDFSVKKTYQDKETLYQDFLIFGLRKIKGISLAECLKRFNKNPLNDFPEIENFINQGLLVVEDNFLKPTMKGIFLLNKIVEVFL